MEADAVFLGLGLTPAISSLLAIWSISMYFLVKIAGETKRNIYRRLNEAEKISQDLTGKIALMEFQKEVLTKDHGETNTKLTDITGKLDRLITDIAVMKSRMGMEEESDESN